ncbi:MAG: hypothetical protein IH891_04715 [Planctomycetes bacterium]|nr:hypothetical protein [Planctomycetota bacterium]
MMTKLWPQLESIGPWIGASAYIIILGITMVWRFESGAWRSIKLLDESERDAAGIAPIGPGVPAAMAEGSYRDLAEEIAESVSKSLPRK